MTPLGRRADGDVTGVVTSVRTAHRFDEAALARWLSGRLPGAESGVRVRQFEGGQSNPTYLLETDRARWVLRKKPSGLLLASAHMIEREHRIMAALHGSGVPVPEVPLLCDDTSVIGTPFFVMAYVHGRIVRDPSLPGLAASERGAVYEDAVATLARLHGVDWAARGLTGFGKTEGYIMRQIRRWSRQYRDTQHRDLPAMDVLHPTESRVSAVLDSELSTLGDPLTDLAYFCIPHHLSREEKGLRGSVDTICRRSASLRRQSSWRGTARSAGSRRPRRRRWPSTSPSASSAWRPSWPASTHGSDRAMRAPPTPARWAARPRPSPRPLVGSPSAVTHGSGR